MANKVADYDQDNYDYEKYWENVDVDRKYEDIAEREVITQLLPKSGNWFCDLGGGFGRLFGTYEDKFKNVILADYSMHNLVVAQKKLKSDEHRQVYFIALNAYHLPFQDGALEAMLSVRLLHHIENTSEFFKEVNRVIAPGGELVLEYPNKRHFLEIMRSVVGKSSMKPFSLEPTKRGELFYNYHPEFIKRLMAKSGLTIKRLMSVSNLRHNIFKKVFGVKVMALTERSLRGVFSMIKFGPSIFVLAQKTGAKKMVSSVNLEDILVCPSCYAESLMFGQELAKCAKCNKAYPFKDGVWDFRVD